MLDITALGELLIDFTPAGLSPQGNPCYERNPGGAPANVAVCMARLGGKAAFIGKVGEDAFGNYLCGVLKDQGVDVTGIRSGPIANTTLAFVHLDAAGERSFSFYRNPGADTQLAPNEVDYDLIRESRVFHFGSLSLTHEPARSATLAAVGYAKEKGCTVSYDPNLRMALWKDAEEARTQMTSVLQYADILKISDEELEFITGQKDAEKGTALLRAQYGIGLILLTLGAEGSFFRLGDATGFRPAFKASKVVDTTGAGDCFLGAFLYFMLSRGMERPQQMNPEAAAEALAFANGAASLCISGKGAIPAMPELNAVLELIT